jgi:mono/diheme cytochrome c family protein
MEINCFSDGKYRSIEQCHRANGDRHAARAKYWLAQGKPDYAEGSMRKARRNWARADAWKTPDCFAPLMKQMLDRINQHIYAQVTSDINSFGGLFK